MWELATELVYLREKPEKYLVAEEKLATARLRCRAAGVPPDLRQVGDVWEGEKLLALLKVHGGCLELVRPLLLEIHRDFSDKTSVIILTDGNGRALDTVSSPEMLEHCRLVGVQQGASFREESCGTNAISLALHHRESVAIRGEQHYCALFADWFCAAAPVFAPGGEAVACLDLSFSCQAQLGFALALVRQTVGRIEALLRREGEAAPREMVSLTSRQRQVLELYSDGLTYEEIAGRLGIARSRVEEIIGAVCKKLEAQNPRGCIKKAILMGLVGR